MDTLVLDDVSSESRATSNWVESLSSLELRKAQLVDLGKAWSSIG